MGVDAGFYMYDVVVKKFTLAISSPDVFLFQVYVPLRVGAHCGRSRAVNTGVIHGCHFGHPCLRAVFTGAGRYYP